MLTTWFIRHAQSESNIGLPTSDPKAIKITERGRSQSTCIATYVVTSLESKPTLIVTSPYVRTKETARPLLEHFNDVQAEEWPVYEFTYLSPQRCQAMTPQERRPMVREFWQRCDPLYEDGEGAESFTSFLRRVHQTIARIREHRDGIIVVFSHILFIQALLWVLKTSIDFPLDAQSMHAFYTMSNSLVIPNGSILKINWHQDERVDISDILWSHISENYELLIIKRSGI